MRYNCINGCKDTWFGYMAKALVEVQIDEKGEPIDTTIYDHEQSKAAICRKCGLDAIQIFEKCRDCGCWKGIVVEGLCLSCYYERIALKKGEK